MILITTQNFLPDTGGIQIYMSGLADTLAARGHAVEVFCDADKDAVDFDSARSYPIHRFGGFKVWQRWTKGRAINQRLAQGDITAMIADSWKSLEHCDTRFLKSIRVFCISHGAELLAKESSAKARRIAAAFAKAGIAAANSHFTANLTRPFLSAKTELCVLNPGVYPPAGASRTVGETSRRTGTQLLTIARFDPYKGIDTVMRAVSRLRKSHPGLVYHVIGDGVDRLRLFALANELGVTDCVRFHGRVDETQKAKLLFEADIFVLANRSEPGEVEGFGIVFVEAGAFGLPAIAGADGGTADAVVDGLTGFRVDGTSDEAVERVIKKLLDDPALAARMGRAGYTRFWSTFAWDAAVVRFETALGLV